MIAFVNDHFIEEEKANLQVSDLALLRGYAAFDFLRTRNFVPLFIDDYIDRFFASAEKMYLKPVQSKKELKEIIHGLIKTNDLSESGIRMILTGGYSADGYEPATPNLIVLQQELQLPSAEKFNAGIKVITHEYQRELPLVKSTNYLMGIWLQQKIREKKAADVLYYNNGMVSEFPRSNIFIVSKQGRIITPSENILMGITRKKLIEWAKENYEVEERALQLDEVKHAAEVFMTSTTKRILPVSQIDEVVIGEGRAGNITAKLNRIFLDKEAANSQ